MHMHPTTAQHMLTIADYWEAEAAKPANAQYRHAYLLMAEHTRNEACDALCYWDGEGRLSHQQ